MENKKRLSKAERRGWALLRDMKPIALTSEMVEGKKLTKEDFNLPGRPVENRKFLIPQVTAYPLKFKITEKGGTKKTPYIFVHIYTFHSPDTKENYVLRAEYHEHDLIALKFYAKKHKSADFKYSLITNKGHIWKILDTCFSLVPIMLEKYPFASFAFFGARSVESGRKEYIEDAKKTQRFIIYQYYIKQNVGSETFTHFVYENISGYMLLNNKCDNIQKKEELISKMLVACYPVLEE